MPLVYSADDERFRFLLRWRHTVLPMVAKDPIFWLLQAWHLYWLRCERHLLEAGESLPKLDWKAATMASALLTFFVVFYAGNCYNRFYQLYANCCGISASMAEWAFLIKVHFDPAPPTVKWNMMRMMFAGMQMHYAKLGSSQGDEKKDITESEWRAIQRNNFLSAEEIRAVRKYRGDAKYFLPVIWALGEVRAALKSKLKPQPLAAAKPMPSSPLNPEVSPDKSARKPSAAQVHEGESILMHTPAAIAIVSDFQQVALKFRSSCGGSLSLMNCPVPYAYFHILKFMTFVALALVSLALIEVEAGVDVMSIVVFAITSMILIGLQCVAVAMSDPFGDDDLDFDLPAFVSAAYDNAIAILVDQRVTLHDRLPQSIDENPLNDSEGGKRVRTWAVLTDGGSGLTAPAPRTVDAKKPIASRASKATPPAAAKPQAPRPRLPRPDAQLPRYMRLEDESAMPAATSLPQPRDAMAC